MLLLIYFVITCIVAFVLVKLIDKFLPSGARPILSVALWAVSIFIAYLIYASVMKPIEFKKEIERNMKLRLNPNLSKYSSSVLILDATFF